MNYKLLLRYLFISCLIASYSTHSKDTPLTLISEPYPPQFSYDLKNNGWLYDLVKATYTTIEVDTNLELINWKRALYTARTEPNHVLFAAYYNNERNKLFHFSQPIGVVTIGFFKLKQNDIPYDGKLESLLDRVIAKGRGYLISEEFDHNNKLTKLDTVDLAESLKLLIAKRVDLVVGTQSTGLYWLKHNPILARQFAEQQVEFIQPALTKRNIYLAFSRQYKDSERRRNEFNQAFKQVLMSKAIQQILSPHGFNQQQIRAYQLTMLSIFESSENQTKPND